MNLMNFNGFLPKTLAPRSMYVEFDIGHLLPNVDVYVLYDSMHSLKENVKGLGG